MSKGNQYKWLLVVEGNSDITTYASFLTRSGINAGDFLFCSAGGNASVRDANRWNAIKCGKMTLFETLDNDLGRNEFKGVLLVVDADTGSDFSDYKRSAALGHSQTAPPTPANKNNQYWHLDTLLGRGGLVPVYGIIVPATGTGCLETDLLASYGFPVAGQPEYAQFETIIQRASDKWNIPKNQDGKSWWEINKKAKLDKFMYNALMRGFEISLPRRAIPSPPAPAAVTAITAAMNAHGPV